MTRVEPHPDLRVEADLRVADQRSAPADSMAPPRPSLPAAARSAPVPRHADVPRAVGVATLDDRLSLVGALASAAALVWLVYSQILGWEGKLGFTLCWYLTFLALYAGVSALGNPRIVVVDRLASAVVQGAAAVVGIALVSTVLYTVLKGWSAASHLNFFVKDAAGVAPRDPLTRGGALHAAVGSAIEVGIATVIALPLGVGTAVYMTEVGTTGARWVRNVIEAMTALPDVLAGLFIYVVLILTLGFPRSGFAAACALAIMMTPIIARSAELQLRIVPGGLREAGLALGASQWQTVSRVVLPTAKSGLATALILGIARAVGETAPVLITSGASTFLNTNPFDNPMNSLPLYILFAVRSGQTVYIARGFGAAALLLLIVLVLFAVTRFLARDKVGRR